MALRQEERGRFEAFASTFVCYMELVRRELDDPHAEPCGQCSNCLGKPIIQASYSDESIKAALYFLKRSEISIEPRKLWPNRALPSFGWSGRIPESRRCEAGLCLSQFGDPGVARWAREDKIAGKFRQELVTAAVEALARMMPDLRPDWVCAVPSRRSDQLVRDFAGRMAEALGVRFVDAVVKVKDTQPQKEQRNSFHQAANLDAAFEVCDVKPGTAILVDDMVDSGWTFTIIGALLREAGANVVVPIALTSTKNIGADD